MAIPSLIKQKLFPQAFLLLTLILTCAIQSRAGTDFTYNGITYTVLTNSTCKTKDGSGSGPGNFVSGDIVIPEIAYDSDGNAYAVTSIGVYAFLWRTGLTSVTIPNSVTSIGHHAFEGCTGLTSVAIPNSVTGIGDYAFDYCTGLTSVTIPNSVTRIGDYAYSSCTDLTSVAIPNSVTSIGEGSFEWCQGLVSVTIPDSVTSIGVVAFAYCTGLTSVTIGNSVTSIKSGAFSGCTALTSITIPNSVTSIGTNAFSNCSSMQKFIVESNNGNYASDEHGALYNKDLSTLLICPGGKKQFDIPRTVTSIGDYAFWWNTGLTSVTIPNSVTSIGASAFNGCAGLTSVTIPSSVTEIDNGAFAGCPGLLQIISLAATPPTIYANTFSDYSVPLIVTSEDYKTANYWGNFTNITVAHAMTYTPTGTTFEVNGLKYEIIDVSDRTCRLYAINESVEGDVVIPEKVLYREREFIPIEIANALIIGESAITSISIPNSISTIASSFGIVVCSSLTKLMVNSAVTNNLIYASSVDELVVASSVNEFSNDLNLNTIGKLTIEDGETALTTTQFKCSGLKEVNLGRSVSESTFAGITSIENVSISDRVASIANSEFEGCSALTALTIPNSVTEIGVSAFSGCTGIVELKFEDGESELTFGDDAFKDVAPTEAYFGRQMNFANALVSELETVEFGENVTSIEAGAFKDAKSLFSVTSHNPVPPTTASTFSNETYLDGTLYVPASSVANYAAAPVWEDFFDIKAIDGISSGVSEIGDNNNNAPFSVENGAICVYGDTDVRIVSMNGTTVYSGRGETRINLTTGVYIVIINNTATKVVVK